MTDTTMNATDAEKIILLLDSGALGVLDAAAKASLRTAAEAAWAATSPRLSRWVWTAAVCAPW